MSKSKIIALPHPALRQPSRKIGLIDQTIVKLAEEMIDQAIAWEKGRSHETTVGLAAVQINQPFRLIIVRNDLQDRTPGRKDSFYVLVNPQITKYAGARKAQFEGCLSVPRYYANIERYEEVKVSALDLEGRPVRFKAEGFAARILQHELDHLKGITTVDRAVPAINKQGKFFAFCQLDSAGKLQNVDEEEVRKAGILTDA